MSSALLPHAVCWAGSPRLIWTMVVANSVVFLSYFSLCATLLFIARRTFRVMARDWILFVVGFALFIAACASTHLLDVITTWIPVFWVDASVTVLTAVLSGYVAIMLIRRAGPIGFAINDYAARLANTEQEKRNLRNQLLSARKVEDWSRMSAVIAHEISNPLEAIQNILYLIQTEDGASAEAKALAIQADQEVGRVITISRSTLSFHRESSRPEYVDMWSVAESVRFLLQGAIRERRVDFQIVGEGDLTVQAFPGETRQVVLNLARNACEATQPGGRVQIEMNRARGGVTLVVTDEGLGIDPQILAALFDFGRSTKGADGNGLGLWSVRQILHKHGGTVELDHSYAGGARFVVWWPTQYAGEVLTEKFSLPAVYAP